MVLNDDPTHQYVDIVEAGDKPIIHVCYGFESNNEDGSLMDDSFPGSQNVTQLSPLES